MSESKHVSCPDCDGLSRRDFLRGVGGVALAAAAGSVPVFATARAAAAPAKDSNTLIADLYGSMSEEQKKAVCFGWDHPKRLMVANNWHIVPQNIGSFYKPEQQEMILEIFKQAHSGEQWVQQRLKQMKDDHPPHGLASYSIAMFGTPGTGKFEWVLTGRHLTLRMDGDSEPGVAFGGPIFYGHAAQSFDEKPDHAGNVYWYQALRANEVYKALDGKQREKALLTGALPADAPKTVISAPKGERPGIAVAEMSRDQRELVGKVLEDLLAPMNKKAVEEARGYLNSNGGLEGLNMAFYKGADIGNDGVWDVWRLEGPSMVWYFRGAPHVHTWVYMHDGTKREVPPGPQG